MHFAFHYGESNPTCDATGFPMKDEALYVTTFRIDTDAYGPHIHFHGENHLFQNRVEGLVISDAEPFIFVQAVLRHRSTGEDFDTIMGFTVRK
jgi:hypothetical protein